MDKLTKVAFETWRKESCWLLTGQGKNNEGLDQDNFLTPAGQLLYIIYDRDGNVRNVAMPMTVPMQMPSMPRSPFPFPGGQPPILGRG